MFAIIRTGGKQYKVSENDCIRVEKIDAEVGSDISLQDVLMVADGDSVKAGPALSGKETVTAEIVAQERGEKIIVFKKKRRANYRRKHGHRQDLTVLKIKSVASA